MKAVLIAFVVAFLGLTGLVAYQRATGGPPTTCHGSSSTANIDHTPDASGPSSPRAAARDQMVDEGDRVVGERQTGAGASGYVFRSYDGDHLLEIVEVHRAPTGNGWLANKHQRCG